MPTPNQKQNPHKKSIKFVCYLYGERNVHKIHAKTRVRRKNKQQNFYGSDCKNQEGEGHIKHAKFLSISLSSSYTRTVINIAFVKRWKLSVRQRQRLLIFMMIIDSIENLSLALFICPFEGIKYFMKSINIIFSLRRFLTRAKYLLRHTKKKTKMWADMLR